MGARRSRDHRPQMGHHTVPFDTRLQDRRRQGAEEPAPRALQAHAVVIEDGEGAGLSAIGTGGHILTSMSYNPASNSPREVR